MATRRCDTEARKIQIAEAAVRVIQMQGMANLSMERIALETGIVPSAIYRHFQNKDEVLDAVLDLIESRMYELVDAVNQEGGSALDRLKTLLKRHITLVQHVQTIPRVLFSDHVYVGNPARKAKLYAIISGYLERIGEIAKEGLADGSIRQDIEHETIPVLMMGMFQPAIMLWFLSDGGFDAARHIDRAWRCFLRGITPDNV